MQQYYSSFDPILFARDHNCFFWYELGRIVLGVSFVSLIKFLEVANLAMVAYWWLWFRFVHGPLEVTNLIRLKKKKT